MSWHEAFARPIRRVVRADDGGRPASTWGSPARPNGPLVELAIGNGRVAVPVAQATGRPVIGIDSSPAMLEQARARRGRGRRRARPARRRHARPLARRARGADLLPVPRAPASADVGRPAPRLRAGRGVAPSRRTVRVERVRVRSPLRRRRSTADRTRHRFPTPSTTPSATTASTSCTTTAAPARLWWATKNEWLGLLDVAGLEVEALYGGFDGEPFDENSREYVFVTRRP